MLGEERKIMNDNEKELVWKGTDQRKRRNSVMKETSEG